MEESSPAWHEEPESHPDPATDADGYEVSVEEEEPADDAIGEKHQLSRRAFVGVAGLVVAGGFFAGGWLARGLFDGREDSESDEQKLRERLLPSAGVTLRARWKDLPARLVREGVIDLNKLETAMGDRGLTAAEKDQLQNGTDQPVHIDADNASYVLDVLWALGLASRNPILTSGAIAQRGKNNAGSYASTGGWTLSVRPGPTYLATLDLTPLSAEQQLVVEEVAANAYRPCCNNATAFPDCNHGMAALGLAELLASQGATANEIFEGLKSVSPFWFPTQYHHLALYFDHQGQQWSRVDARQVMAKERSSAAGWAEVNTWLEQRGFFDHGSGGKGGGCAA